MRSCHVSTTLMKALVKKVSKNEGKSSPNVIIWASGGPQCALVGAGYPKSRLVAPFGVPLGGLGRPIDSIGLPLGSFWEPFCLKIGTLGVSWAHLGTLSEPTGDRCRFSSALGCCRRTPKVIPTLHWLYFKEKLPFTSLVGFRCLWASFWDHFWLLGGSVWEHLGAKRRPEAISEPGQKMLGARRPLF